MSVTAGQLLSASQALAAVAGGLSASGLDLSSLSGDAIVGEDILSVVAVFWPPAALLEAALAIAVELLPLLPEIHLTPDQDPEHDAQTSTDAHVGRN